MTNPQTPDHASGAQGSGGRPTAIVTGASRGIGRGIAVALARAGFDLVLNYVSNDEAAQAAREKALEAARRLDSKQDNARTQPTSSQSDLQSDRIELCCADVSLDGGRRKLIGFARGHFNHLDLLVNNAGVGPANRVSMLKGTEESFDRVLGTNLKGPYFLTQLVANWMLESQGQIGASGYRPCIVNIGSISAYTASPDRGEYCIAKAGVAMMTKLYAAELAANGINVYEVRPGIIETDMTRPAQAKYTRLIEDGLTPIRRWGTPDDIGRAVAAIATGALPFSTGEVINVDGGFHLRIL